MDELPEFPRSVLESLRQPLEDGVVSVARVGGHALLPGAIPACRDDQRLIAPSCFRPSLSGSWKATAAPAIRNADGAPSEAPFAWVESE